MGNRERNIGESEDVKEGRCYYEWLVEMRVAMGPK